ncbi:bacteriocin [Clostridium botulinum C]|uniref:Bacteriocin n=2 Tax=Clostridium botulinum TaxID=1491 RepID=A0A9Q4TPS2_CLOBO|nr:peptidoglycan-binding protein [Clostridium botulinum]MCD3195720.1 bacteriocin [Clostridium botulinum C]MCD3201136.1 bacteriocin [Clostridium botulinum C]MCD3206612.1 bacteriocin [Clostridium botulinum C]MCD3209389.1 bacteriocin [Clostridium botulinum C]MCD3226521.1 bacteriocin [Clostridium botulinum C]
MKLQNATNKIINNDYNLNANIREKSNKQNLQNDVYINKDYFESSTINNGCYGEEVAKIQSILKDKGYYDLQIDGYFGNDTKKAVSKFQLENNINNTGEVDLQTKRAIIEEPVLLKRSKRSLKSNGNLIRRGDRGSNVEGLQKKLISLGYNCGKYGADGVFGEGTYNAVKAFQRAKGLNTDGIVGPDTMRAINNSKGSNIPDITQKLNNLMIRYEYMYMDIKNASGLERLGHFYNLVKNGSAIDLKNQGWNSKKYIYNGEVIDNDAPGNIAYGYLGKAFGFSDELLLRAAGYAQQKAGTSKPEWGKPWGSPPYGDDPRDQARIKQGIKVYNGLHKR